MEPNDITLKHLQDVRSVLLERNDMKLAEYIIEKRDGIGQVHRALSVLMTPFSAMSNNGQELEEQTEIRHQRTCAFYTPLTNSRFDSNRLVRNGWQR